MRVAEGIAASAQLLWDLWQWPSQNACRATRWQEAWTDLIEPLQRVDGHLAAGNVERPARGMVAELVAAGLEVAAGTRGMRQSAQTVRRVSEQDFGSEERKELSYVWVVLGSLVLVWGGEGLRKVAGIGRGSVGRIQTWLLRILLLERRLVSVLLLASVH